MPISEQPALPQDRPPSKDDIPVPPREPPPTTEQPKINPEEEECLPNIEHLKSTTPLSEEVKQKYKPPSHPDQPLCESEYDNLDDDIKQPLIDKDTLSQLLELDDDDDREFCKEMVRDYFKQAEKEFDEMDKHFLSRNLPKLSSSGHFLKGSSAALGLSRVQSTCEKIQHCGAKRDEILETDLSEDDAVEIMERLLKKVRLQYREAKDWLVDFFENNRSLDDVPFWSASRNADDQL